jgi:hypothetical protein
MKKFVTLAIIIATTLSLTTIAGATSYTFEPSDYGAPDDLYDLDHYRAVSWGIDGSEIDLSTETISAVKLNFENIRNWDRNDNDLYIRLFDTLAPFRDDAIGVSGKYEHRDNQASGDYFESWGGTELHHYEDLSHIAWENSSYDDKNVMTYEFDASELSLLTDYLSDGIFGLTFDADCHFYNDGVSLEIVTADPVSAVPEPSTVLLLGCGVLGLIGISRRQIKK